MRFACVSSFVFCVIGAGALGCSATTKDSETTGATGGDTTAGGGDTSSGGTNASGGTVGGGGPAGSGGSVGVGGTTTTSLTGGAPASGGALSTGGSVGSGGVTGSGGTADTGGTTATGGTISTGGITATGGSTGVGGTTSTGGTTATGGSTSVGGTTSTGGTMATGGTTATGGSTGVGGTTSTGGTTATGGSTTGTGGGSGVDCSTPMPTGGETYTGASVYGTVNGLNYGIWTNGSGGTITVFPDAHAFSASWDNSLNFLAHLGLDFRGSDAKPYTEYGTIIAEFVEEKYGDPGGFSMIGMYGWMHNPCIEWYINEDSYNGLFGRGDITATIDGATYYLSTAETTGTDGANACESGHTGPWTQLHSVRETARQCGTVTVSDHFKAWEAQGWTLGDLTSVHINVEVGGGVGSIDFPVANVTTSN